MPSPCPPYSGSPCRTDSYCPVPCSTPEYCVDVYADKCIVHKGNYLPNLDISDGTRLDVILAAIDTKLIVSNVFLGSGILSFPTTNPGASSELTISVPGVTDGNVVQLGFQNICYNPGSCYTARVSASDIVSIAFNNYSSAPITPLSGFFSVIVFQ